MSKVRFKPEWMHLKTLQVKFIHLVEIELYSNIFCGWTTSFARYYNFLLAKIVYNLANTDIFTSPVIFDNL